jgi:alkylation response protein AidB-like acyl-CoA dehydrogenase
MLAATSINEEAVRLERYLGNPHDSDAPLSYVKVLKADEAAKMSETAEEYLDEWRLNEYFVPRELGGKFTRFDTMAEVLRPVFRRDFTLGLGYGVTSFMAAVNVWLSGSEKQKKQLADLLLQNEKVAVAYHELNHGNDFVRNELKALSTSEGFRLSGQKHVINNIERARSIVLFAQTSEQPGSRSHSLFLLDKNNLAKKDYSYLPRYRTVGVTGCQIGGIEFKETSIDRETLVGKLGSGVETALKAFQITRCVLPTMSVSVADTAIRTVLEFALKRQLYHKVVADLPHARSTLVNAFLDLLIVDCLSLSMTRGLHALPEQMSVYSSIVKYFVPSTIKQMLYDLSIVLGARFYLRDGEYGIFQKLLRDYPVVSFGHAGTTICQASVIPQLRFLARKSWGKPLEKPEQLPKIYDLSGDLPPFQPERLRISNNGEDDIIRSLKSLSIEGLNLNDCSLSEHLIEELRSQIELLNLQLEKLIEDVEKFHCDPQNTLSDLKAFKFVEKYAIILAATSCINTYSNNHHQAERFFKSGRWLVAALRRLLNKLSSSTNTIEDNIEFEEEILAEMSSRLNDNYSFTLSRSFIAG